MAYNETWQDLEATEDTISEYFRGATMLSDPTGEFAGYPVRIPQLGEQRAAGADAGTPDWVFHELVAEYRADELRSREIDGPDWERTECISWEIRMLGALIARHPEITSARDMAQVVFDTRIAPQQDLVANARHQDAPYLEGVIGTAVTGGFLFDRLLAQAA